MTGSEHPSEVIVGLDVGTTGVKAVAFGIGSAWRVLALREYALLTPAPDQEVQDPDTILQAVASALAECVSATAGADVLAISVSTAMHALIGLDAELTPLTPLITWADSRARVEARDLRGCDVDLHTLTGAPVHPMTPVTKLAWFARHEPRTLAGARWWVGLKELVLEWLTGRLVSELSSASGTGLLDMATRDWSPAAIKLAGITATQLPEILPTTARLGLCADAARRTGLREGTPVVVGAGDGPLGNLGTGAMAPGIAGLSLGTSGAVRMAISEPRIDRDRTLFCYALTDSVWVIGGAISNGGAVVRWAEQALAPDLHGAADRVESGGGADVALLELAASAPPGSAGLVMLPYLMAERAPLWAGQTGAYLGLQREHTRAHMARAAIEGVCLQLRLIVDRLAEVEPVRSLRATGGVFRSALWCEVVSAMLGRPVLLMGEAEGTALGAAALGLFALGRANTLTDACALLAAPDAPVPAPLGADPELVALYDGHRALVADRIGELDRVRRLFAAPGG